MGHDGHLVKRGLTIENDNVPVAQLPLHDPSIGKEKVGLVLHVAKINASSVRTDNVFSTRVGRGTVCNEGAELGEVKGGDVDWHGEVHCH